MRTYKNWINVPLILFVVIVLQFGCGSTKPSRFYVLTPMVDAEAERAQSNISSDISVGIDQLKFPDFLLRPQIVTQSSANKMDYAEYDRWAESLDENFSRVMAENLSKLIPTENVYVFPWKSSTVIHYRLTFAVTQFSMEADKNISLIVFWSIFDNTTAKELLRKKTTLSQPGPTSDPLNYGQIVAVMSRLVEDFSHEIVTELKTIARK